MFLLVAEFDPNIAKRLGYDAAKLGDEIVVFDVKNTKIKPVEQSLKEQPKAEPQKKVEQVSVTQKSKQPTISKTETTKEGSVGVGGEVEMKLKELGVDNGWFDNFKKENPNTLLGIEDKSGFIKIIDENGESKKIESSDFYKELKSAISNGYKGIAKISEKDLATQTKEIVKNRAKREGLS